jgi:hypothetical protein
MDEMDALGAFYMVLGLVLIVLAIPTRYDPAILLREWLERKDDK